MPSLQLLSDTVTLNIGTFEKGKWDYVGLAQLYPTLEVLAQLVPRKSEASNYEATIVYQTRTDSTGHGANPGDPIQPVNRKKALRRKISLVKYVDSMGWTLDQESLQGKSDEHIVKQIQMDMVAFDLDYWQDLEHMLLKMPSSGTPSNDETMFGFGAYVTAKTSPGTNEFDLFGGADPYNTGRPGNITVAVQPGYTNPTARFQGVNDDDFFDKLEQFLMQRKLMGVVPNPRLIPDTPNDVAYCQLPVVTAVQRYLTASNENVGMDAGRYRGQSQYKGIPITLWHAAGHPDSPVADSTCVVRVIDWNSFRYEVQPEFDRKITGPQDINGVPSAVSMASELWHQLACDRPDRNLYMDSVTPALQP